MTESETSVTVAFALTNAVASSFTAPTAEAQPPSFLTASHKDCSSAGAGQQWADADLQSQVNG